MILDYNLLFTGGTTSPPGNSDNATDSPTTGATQACSQVVDIGLTGLPTSASGGGARDLGIADSPALKLLVVVTVAFGGGTNIAILFQGAPDGGAGTPGAYTTMYTGPTVVEASLIAGARLADIDVPRQVPGQALPRFLRIAYSNTGTHTSGKLEGAIVLDRHDQPEQSNAVLGGYPAGITIAN
jgi:hypothetical protein